MSGEEVVIVRATTSRLGPRSVGSYRQHQLKFEAFNQTYDLTLQPSTGLVSPHFSIIVRNDTNTTQTIPTQSLTRCFYRGQDAAFDLCQGMVRITCSINWCLLCSSLSSFSINREGLLRCLPVSSLVLNPFDTANDQQTAYKVDTWSVECRGILAGFLLPKTENALDEMPILSKGKALQSRRPFLSMPFSTITWRERISRTTLNSSWHTLFLQWLMR